MSNKKSIITKIMHMLKCLTLFGFLGGTCIYANPFTAPKSIDMFGKQYNLAFQNENNALAFYEYTANNESVENWSHLITLQFYKQKIDSQQYVTAMKASLEHKSPKPHYTLYQDAGHGYALLIFEPSREHLNFEADVQKTFNPTECDGTVLLQYGTRTSVLQEVSSEEKNKMIEDISQQLKSTAAQLAENRWTPDCK
jgi:hypothetical protein